MEGMSGEGQTGTWERGGGSAALSPRTSVVEYARSWPFAPLVCINRRIVSPGYLDSTVWKQGGSRPIRGKHWPRRRGGGVLAVVGV